MRTLLRRLYWIAYLACGVPWQARYPFASYRRIEQDRDHNVRRMVRHAYRFVPYYRRTFDRLGLAPNDIQTFDDLRKLPLISVEDIQRDPDAFQSTWRRSVPRVAETSSGSTGSPHTIWHDQYSIYTNVIDAERERRMLQKLIGKGWGYTSLLIGSRNKNNTDAASRAGTYWPKWLALKRSRVAHTLPLPELVNRLNQEKPDLLGGYGSTLTELFMYLDATGKPFHHPTLIRYVSEELSPTVRIMIESKYGIPVFSAYQTSEAFKLGWECEAHQGYHINVDHYPIRIIDSDGNDVAEGEVGEVVVSNLTNYGTVLLNYRQGDLAQRIDTPCPCGRHLPRIGHLQGRVLDCFVTTAGERVNYRSLERIFRKYEPLWQWQSVQETRDRILFNLRLAPNSNQAAARQLVIEAARQWLGESMEVEVRIVDALDRSAAGKLRHVINNIKG